MGLGPFDLYGADFLALYIGLLVLAGIVSLLLPHWTRPPGRPGRIQDLDELAYLANGTARMAEAAAARLLAQGAVKIEGKDSLRTLHPDAGGTAVERSLLGLARPAKWPVIVKYLADHGTAIGSRLMRNGLLLDPLEGLRARLRHTLPLLALLLFGVIKFFIGEARERPADYLLALLIFTAVLAALRFGALDRRTEEGQALLSEESKRADRLRRAPTAEELGLAVALFGTTVLVGSQWAALHDLRRDSGGDGGSSGDSDGDSGCGGGGCGGCGG
jgi:uncharacterized protein (TIGR04222 family)